MSINSAIASINNRLPNCPECGSKAQIAAFKDGYIAECKKCGLYTENRRFDNSTLSAVQQIAFAAKSWIEYVTDYDKGDFI